MKTPQNRSELGAFLNEIGLTGSMVEIGVAFGGYSLEVLSAWKGKEYVMVDPWVTQPADVYKERTDNIPYESWYQQCVSISKSDDRVKLVRDYSVDAAALFPDGYFDCVYIDGNHCYEAFTADYYAWWPKVKSGGVFSGHDCYNATTEGHYCEVLRAMEDLQAKTNLKYAVTPCTSWWMIKP